MRLRELVWTGCISAAIAVFVVPAAAATHESAHECVAGKPTAASYTRDFKGEANAIFRDVQVDAQQALSHADRLRSFTEDPNLGWETHASQLEGLKDDINDIGAKLCRLETIRRVLAPWQQREIDQMATTVRLMADNAQDAIQFVSAKQDELWLGTYQKYLNNIDDEAESLTRSVTNAVEFAGVSKDPPTNKGPRV